MWSGDFPPPFPACRQKAVEHLNGLLIFQQEGDLHADVIDYSSALLFDLLQGGVQAADHLAGHAVARLAKCFSLVAVPRQ